MILLLLALTKLWCNQSEVELLSSSGLGHCPLTAVTGVQIPMGAHLFL